MDVIRKILMALLALVALAALPWLLLWFLAARRDTGWTDVTHDPSFGNFAAVIGTWKSKVPLRLVEIKDDLHVVWGDQFIPGSKELAMLPVGTEIRIEQLRHRETFATTYLHAMGSLTVGPDAGRQLQIDDRLFVAELLSQARLHRGEKQVKETTWAVAADRLTK